MHTSDGDEIAVHADLYLDATETGDLLEMGGVEHAIGAESVRVYDERMRADLPAGTDLDPLDQQAFTWCFAVEHRAGRITPSRGRPGTTTGAHIPEMTPAWTGPLFSWTVPSHNEAGSRRFALVPPPDQPDEWELWRYRAIVDASVHTDRRPDVSLFNCVQIDYWGEPLLGVSADARDRAARRRARAVRVLPALDADRGAPARRGRRRVPGSETPGRRTRFRRWLRGSRPYIREPRRLIARTMLTERHVGTQQRAVLPGQGATPDGVGELFADSVAVGHYPIDLHPSCAGRNSVYVAACPFRVPMGAAVPVRTTNLLAAGKCLGVSHVANGSTRLHPVEWGIGSAAGVVAAECLDRKVTPNALHADRSSWSDVRTRLHAAGCPTAWPWEI